MTNYALEEQTESPIGMRLGVLCTAALALAYMAFILLGAFAPGLMAQPVKAGGTMTVAMVLGFGIIALGFVLTCVYAISANAADASSDTSSYKRGE